MYSISTILSSSQAETANCASQRCGASSELVGASGRAAYGMSSDQRNQRHRDAPHIVPTTLSLAPNRAMSVDKHVLSSSSNTSDSTSAYSFKNRRALDLPGNHNSDLSSNYYAHKPRRKRRHDKKAKLL